MSATGWVPALCQDDQAADRRAQGTSLALGFAARAALPQAPHPACTPRCPPARRPHSASHHPNICQPHPPPPPSTRYWDLRQSNPAFTFNLSERLYALDVKHPLLVAGTADRQLYVFNLQVGCAEFGPAWVGLVLGAGAVHGGNERV